MICPKCNTANEKSNKFCYSCGSQLDSIESSERQECEQTLPQNSVVEQDDHAETAANSDLATKTQNKPNKAIRFILAILACAGIFFIHVLFWGVILRLKNGGGMIPMLITFSCMGFTWRAITGSNKEK